MCWAASTWREVELWEGKLANEAVLWFFITGLVLFFGATRVAEQDDFFVPTAKKFLTFGILAEVFVNFVVLPLPVELILLLLLTVLVALSAFTEDKEEYAPAPRCGHGDDCGVRARRPALHRDQRRP